MENSQVNVRKSVYDLTDDEIQQLRDAFTKLYTTKLPHKPYNVYQEQAGILQHNGHYQRNDMLFLPWARAYFFNFERVLQQVSTQSIMLPYWNYTSAQAIAEGLPKIFAEPLYQNLAKELVPNPLYQANYIIPLKTFREVNDNTSLLEKAQKSAQIALKVQDFIDFGTSIYTTDILSHSYLGGSVANSETTSYDPIFWFTHCQLDHFWWQWQQHNPSANNSVPNSVKEALLKPFMLNGEPMRGRDVLNTEVLGYTY